MNHKQQLDHAIAIFNDTERRDFIAETGLAWRGLDGDVYLIGAIRVLGLFTGPDGRAWGDAALAVESMGPIRASLAEGLRQEFGDRDDCHDLWVVNEVRGRWNALIVPVDDIAAVIAATPAARMPPGQWARSWLDMPERTDDEELAWIANGGKPIRSFHIGGQL